MRQPGMRAVTILSVPAVVSGIPLAHPVRVRQAREDAAAPSVHRLDFVLDASRWGEGQRGFSVWRTR